MYDASSSPRCILNPPYFAQMPQDDSQHHFVMPGNRNVALGVEGNWDTKSAYNDPSNCFQGYPDVSLIPFGSSLSGLPDSGESRAYGLPSFSFSSTSTCPPAFETSRNLVADPGMVFPPFGASRSTSLHDQFGESGMLPPCSPFYWCIT